MPLTTPLFSITMNGFLALIVVALLLPLAEGTGAVVSCADAKSRCLSNTACAAAFNSSRFHCSTASFLGCSQSCNASVTQLLLSSPNVLSNCTCSNDDFSCIFELLENNGIIRACVVGGNGINWGDYNFSIPDFNFSIPDFNFSIPDFNFSIPDFNFNFSIPNFNYSDFNISTPNIDYGFSEACRNTLSQCLREASCFTEIARYPSVCQPAFIGGKPSDCSPECMASYRKLNATLIGRESMNCVQCAGNTSDLLAMLACRATTANFRRSCLDEKSDFDSPLLDTYARCTRADEQCSADSTCKNAYKAYDDNCESAATTGNPSNCSQSCKTGLSELYADEVGRQLINCGCDVFYGAQKCEQMTNNLFQSCGVQRMLVQPTTSTTTSPTSGGNVLDVTIWSGLLAFFTLTMRSWF
ncbi:uncharacterized protein [Oscarella lobularis]|uniref:uncharacterized protein n=1 Tax=Oscarella lobularis TaxID=121494 RepID=UPI003313FA6B